MRRFLQRTRRRMELNSFEEPLVQPARELAEAILRSMLQSGDEAPVTREHLSSWVASAEGDLVDAILDFLVERGLIETAPTDGIGFKLLDKPKCYSLLAFLTDLVVQEANLDFTIDLEALCKKSESGLRTCASFLLATQGASRDGGLSPFPRILEESGMFATFDMLSAFLTPLQYLADLSPSLVEDYLEFLLSREILAHRSPVQALLEAILFGLRWQNLDGGFPPLADVLWVEDSYAESTGDAVVAMRLFSSFLVIADESSLRQRILGELQESLSHPDVATAFREGAEIQHRIIRAFVNDSSPKWERELREGVESVLNRWNLDAYRDGPVQWSWEALRGDLMILAGSSRYSAVRWLLNNYVEEDEETGYWPTRKLAPRSETELFWDLEGRVFATYFGWHALDLYYQYDATYRARQFARRVRIHRDNSLRWLIRNCPYGDERQVYWSYRDRSSNAKGPSFAMTAMICSLLTLCGSRQKYDEDDASLVGEVESLGLIDSAVQWLEDNAIHWDGTDEEAMPIGPKPTEQSHVYHITYSRKPHILWALFDYYCLYLPAKHKVNYTGIPIVEISDLPISSEGKTKLLERSSFILGLSFLFKELEGSEDRCCYERRSGFITPATSANAAAFTLLALIFYFVCGGRLSGEADSKGNGE